MNFLKLYNEAIDIIKKHYYHKRLLSELRGKRTICLIAGHHKKAIGNDPGACANQTNEHYEVFNICNRAWEILQRDGFNAIVCPTNLNLSEKTTWINKNFPDCVLLSVHLNAAYNLKVSGCEAWYLSGNEEMKKKAVEATKIMMRNMNINGRGEKGDLQSHHGSLGILRDTKPVDELLLELGFLTNVNDLTRVRLKGGQAVADCAKILFYK